MKRFASIALVAMSIVVAPMAASAAGDTPDATISLSGKSAAVGIGFAEGHGTLQYNGKSYPVKLEGLSIISVGASSFTATGDVYHLSKLDDLNGNYVVASAGATLAGGGSATAMKNQNGVVIQLRSTNEGLQFNLSLEGMSLKLAQ